MWERGEPLDTILEYRSVASAFVSDHDADVVIDHLHMKERICFMHQLISRTLGSLLLLAVVVVSLPNSAPALPPVQGEVVSITAGIPGAMVIRDDKGQLHILNLTQQTQLGAQFKVGDRILAFFSPYGVSAVQLQMGSR